MKSLPFAIDNSNSWGDVVTFWIDEEYKDKLKAFVKKRNLGVIYQENYGSFKGSNRYKLMVSPLYGFANTVIYLRDFEQSLSPSAPSVSPVTTPGPVVVKEKAEPERVEPKEKKVQEKKERVEANDNGRLVDLGAGDTAILNLGGRGNIVDPIEATSVRIVMVKGDDYYLEGYGKQPFEREQLMSLSEITGQRR